MTSPARQPGISEEPKRGHAEQSRGTDATEQLVVRSQVEIAAQLGCTKQAVDNCEKRALRKIRRAVLDDPELMQALKDMRLNMEEP